MKLSIGSRIFLWFLAIQLVSGGLILGWYLYSASSDLNARTWSNAQQTVSRSIEETERYFLPAETVI